MKIKSYLANTLKNFRGIQFQRKLVIFESDDWGSIRIPSTDVIKKLTEFGIRVENCTYATNDNLENAEDLNALYDVLSKYRDHNNNKPIITTNFIMANPDFEKIKKNNFQHYYYEEFTKTYERYYGEYSPHKMIKEGLANNLINPQYHGREHLNIARWIKSLNNKSQETNFTFDLHTFGISTQISTEKRKSFLAAYDFESVSEIDQHKSILLDGLKIFKSIFGYESLSMIAPNYVWHPLHERIMREGKIEYLQGASSHLIPSKGKLKLKRHHLGERSANGLIYLVRNCSFEPAFNLQVDWVARAVSEIKNAFLWKKPAIISTHRVNFIGSLNESNRRRNLEFLDSLLRKILLLWPDIEFLTSNELGEIIKKAQFE